VANHSLGSDVLSETALTPVRECPPEGRTICAACPDAESRPRFPVPPAGLEPATHGLEGNKGASRTCIYGQFEAVKSP
jgi:hypothetical protein